MNAKALLIGLGTLAGILVLMFIANITGGSGWAMLATLAMIPAIMLTVAKATGVIRLPKPAVTLLNLIITVCMIIIGTAFFDEWRRDLALRSKVDRDEEVRRRAQQPSVVATTVFTRHEIRKLWFNPARPALCLKGWVDDPKFYGFGGDGDITIHHEDDGNIYRYNKYGWVGTPPVGQLRAGNYSFCRTYQGSVDSVHVYGHWRISN